MAVSSNNPIRYRGLDHVVLKVTDMDRALAFYVDVLGMTLERTIEDYQIYQLRCGEHLLDLALLRAGEELPPRDARGTDHVCFLLEGEMDTLLAHLNSAEIAPEFGPQELYGATGFGLSVYIRDPDGHKIELKIFSATPAGSGDD